MFAVTYFPWLSSNIKSRIWSVRQAMGVYSKDRGLRRVSKMSWINGSAVSLLQSHYSQRSSSLVRMQHVSKLNAPLSCSFLSNSTLLKPSLLSLSLRPWPWRRQWGRLTCYIASTSATACFDAWTFRWRSYVNRFWECCFIEKAGYSPCKVCLSNQRIFIIEIVFAVLEVINSKFIHVEQPFFNVLRSARQVEIGGKQRLN